MSGNDYFDAVVSMSPNDMVARFQATAPTHIQEAAKRTVMRFLGSIPGTLMDDVTYSSAGEL